MKPTIAVAVSGGVDSMMAAHLLTSRGHRVFGIHFVTGYEVSGGRRRPRAGPCASAIDGIGRQLGIDVVLHDCREEFERRVIQYFVRTYSSGRTPNPCLVCNPRIKFGTIWKVARKLGAERLATGHYARIGRGSGGRLRLFKGVDAGKDQSYFLSRLTQTQLRRACFPLGGMTKEGVRELARSRDLQTTIPEESQDVCFVKRGSYGEFLAARPGFHAEPGPIETTDGKQIGRHRGLHLFTIGQRRGINCPASEPYYVIRLDKPRNCLVVGFKADLSAQEFDVADINWIAERPAAPVSVLTRVRYRHREQPSRLTPCGPLGARVRFATPQEAITPGQGAVFYRGSEVLGGGFIADGAVCGNETF
jgi:tRNA-specific 2-thiouridylase